MSKTKKVKGDAPGAPPPSQLPKPTETEVEAYGFIRQQLQERGWVVKDPSKSGGGHVWTQNQCLAEPRIKTALGATRPENIVKCAEDVVWVIEAKAARKDLAKAVSEATTFYAQRINAAPNTLRAPLATGVAGNQDAGYFVQTRIFVDGMWQTVTINGQEATGFLSPDDVRVLMETGGTDVHEFTPPRWSFVSAAERINEILHGGGINKNDRAKTMAALLLSVIHGCPGLDSSLPVLISDINGRSEAELSANGKSEFAPFVKILPPTNTTNHVKFRGALVKTIQELQNLNIRSAMNSSTDVLGQFYEVFLKYGNGAKEIGIVLTPRHITQFAVDAIGVSPTDVVLDPACGTGGFLVAAFDHVRQHCTPQQLDRFKRYNLFGIEQESYVAVLAIVNMIFRGDGKHNIAEGNCFTTHLTAHAVKGHPSAVFSKSRPDAGDEPVTRVLMNPPFALTGSQETEYRFVSQALSVMAPGGLLFALVPLDVLFGSHGTMTWRQGELLKHHTLLAVITMPDELFYPAAQKQVAGVIVRKGFPHPKTQSVFWARIAHDGHLKLKSRRLPAGDLRPPRTERNDIPQVIAPLRSFIASPSTYSVNVPMLCKTAPIDFSDPSLELLPEAYLDTAAPTAADLARDVDLLVRETAAFLVRFGRESKVTEYEE